jgi:hypothetical protein
VGGEEIQMHKVQEGKMSEKFDGDAWLCEGCEWLPFNPTKRIQDCPKCVFLAGRIEQARRDREAVEKRLEYYETGSLGNKIINGDIAALAAVAPEGKHDAE